MKNSNSVLVEKKGPENSSGLKKFKVHEILRTEATEKIKGGSDTIIEDKILM